MSTNDADAVREQAAKQLLGGRDRIKAKAHGLTPVQAARRWYSDDALEAVEAALDDDRAAVTDELLATVRDDERDLEDLDQSAVTANAADAGSGSHTDSDIASNIMSAGEFVGRKKKKRERLEADDSDATLSADEVALSAMDGTDRVEAEAAGKSPADFVREQYGVDPSSFSDPTDLHKEILDRMD
jgi:hypothetical protein